MIGSLRADVIYDLMYESTQIAREHDSSSNETSKCPYVDKSDQVARVNETRYDAARNKRVTKYGTNEVEWRKSPRM